MCGLFLALAAPVGAHDLWIETASLDAGSPGAGVLAVELRLGHPGGAEAIPRRAERIVRFGAIHGGREVAVPGLGDGRPAGFLRPEPGLTTVVYQGDFAFSALAAERFEAYLREAGLDHVAAARRAAGTAGRPGRERYARALKHLLWTASPSPVGSPIVDRARGLAYELVLEGDLGRDGGPVTLRLLDAAGRPVPGVMLAARRLDAPARPEVPEHRGRSGRDGRLRWSLGPGLWMISGVHARVADPGAKARGGEPVDWETWFVSLTFHWPLVPPAVTAALERP